jgi:hypothetical protein
MAGLWVFGQWAAIGFGLFEGGIAASVLLGSGSASKLLLSLHETTWGMVWGLSAGLLMPGVLWLLRYEASRPKG